MPMPPKICPECREEYVHVATVCIHCDISLVLEEDLASRVSATEELPPASEMTCVRASSLGWAMSLSELLSEAGIPHRIQAATDDEAGERRKPGHNLPYGVFVLAEHEQAATRIDLAHTGRQIPDVPEDFAHAEISADACPACGEAVAATATECPGCGLALLPPE